ncbi:hypothetical protein OF83DRAFT_1056889 [Amylostereum chailletii]|nr:hypothetical protein OF83DRAFT_1056889 [Amylostereum chailletii]
MASVRELIKTLRGKYTTTTDFDFKDGISLLSLKHHVLLSYMQSLVLLNAQRALGHALSEHGPPLAPFSSAEREQRGSAPGDFVDAVVEGRLVLEKTKILEGRMRYQIEKLVRLAEEAPTQNTLNDPLAFRPNPQALVGGEASDEEDEDTGGADGRDGIYRPPKLAPMPYTDARGKDKGRRAPVPSTLASLAQLDPTAPYVEAASGLGSAPTQRSGRAREIARMTEFEEDNMTRLVMKKSEARRRVRDEEDIALGGSGLGGGRHALGGGLDDEFADVLRSVGRGGRGGDGYEELRARGKKEGVLARVRTRKREDDGMVDEGPRMRKKSRFEKETKAAKKRTGKK